jgi:hypothetical protein
MGYLRFGDGDLYIFKAQRLADEGSRPYAFSDPQQVAVDFLAEETKIDASLFHLHPIKSTPVRVIYEGYAGGSGRTYWVVVSKQAWLASYAKDPAKIVWAVIGAFVYGGDT